MEGIVGHDGDNRIRLESILGKIYAHKANHPVLAPLQVDVDSLNRLQKLPDSESFLIKGAVDVLTVVEALCDYMGKTLPLKRPLEKKPSGDSIFADASTTAQYKYIGGQLALSQRLLDETSKLHHGRTQPKIVSEALRNIKQILAGVNIVQTN